MFSDYTKSFLNLLFPAICIHCGNALAGNEKHLCSVCMSGLPQTNYWNQIENPVEKTFWGRVKLERAAAFLYFEKGSITQNILHNLKYNGRKELGVYIGRQFGIQLLDSDFNEVDFILPVPLHKKRMAKRGYNQSEMIALGIGEKLNKPVIIDALKRLKPNKSQTNKNRYNRWLNSEGIFSCAKPEVLDGKHVLLIDDIITTGATIESLVQEIIKKANVKISVVSLATAT